MLKTHNLFPFFRYHSYSISYRMIQNYYGLFHKRACAGQTTFTCVLHVKSNAPVDMYLNQMFDPYHIHPLLQIPTEHPTQITSIHMLVTILPYDVITPIFDVTRGYDVTITGRMPSNDVTWLYCESVW